MHPLRPYQIESIEKIKKAFLEGKKKVLLVAPTGSGKTVIAAEMIRRTISAGKHCVFVCHRRELIMQASRKLFEFGINHGVIMAGKSPTPDSLVQVMSIQTYTARKENYDFIAPDAALVIVDEAHRSGSQSFQSLMEAYKESFYVGLTATPCRQNGKGLGNVYDCLVETSNIQKLIKQKYLVPVRVFAPTVPDVKGLRIINGDYEQKKLDKRINRPKLIGDIVKHWQRLAAGRSTVIFGTSINHSKHIAKIFNENNIEAGHIDSKMDEEEREVQMELLRTKKIQVLCNCQILLEGFDYPPISCVVLARPTKSFVLYLQAIGRALRIAENKKDCMILDHSGAVYEFGRPDENFSWHLDKSVNVLKKKIEKQDFTCIRCNYIYKPTKDYPECPNCAFLPTKKTKEVLIKQGRLKEVPKAQRKVTAKEKEDFFAQLRHYSLAKGYQVGWCSYVYKNKFGHFPRTTDIKPILTTEKVLKYIKHYNIKRIKGKERIDKLIGGFK